MATKADINAAKSQGGTPPAKSGPTVDVGGPSDKDDKPTGLRSICGTESKAFNNVLTNQALSTLWLPPGTKWEDQDRRYQAAVMAMAEFKPTDGIEGMMAAQAVGLHSASMECLRRAMISDQRGEAADKLRRQGANLSRAFLDVVAALDRKRGKGARQVVRVERVMVAPGGQAIVGNVQAGAAGKGQRGGGVGHDRETEGEPHATPARRTPAGTSPAELAHDTAPGAVLPPLRSADTGRDALPVACDAQRPMQNARGQQHGA